MSENTKAKVIFRQFSFSWRKLNFRSCLSNLNEQCVWCIVWTASCLPIQFELCTMGALSMQRQVSNAKQVTATLFAVLIYYRRSKKFDPVNWIQSMESLRYDRCFRKFGLFDKLISSSSNSTFTSFSAPCDCQKIGEKISVRTVPGKLQKNVLHVWSIWVHEHSSLSVRHKQRHLFLAMDTNSVWRLTQLTDEPNFSFGKTFENKIQRK